MKRYGILLLLMVACAGCVPATMRDPVLIGKDIAVAEVPAAVSAAALATAPGGQIVSAALIELNHAPDSYLLRTKDADGTHRLLEVSPDGKNVKDITEHPAGG